VKGSIEDGMGFEKDNYFDEGDVCIRGSGISDVKWRDGGDDAVDVAFG
jgi:hypothetical protein